MITYQQATSDWQLQQILLLQQENLPKNLTAEAIKNQGFLTVEHTYEVLEEMNSECGHIIALENKKLVGYALCMHPKFAQSIEILKPMFREINAVVEGKKNYMVMGQVCVSKSHRGKGIFRGLYKAMKEKLPQGIDTIITEVDASNLRSMHAHKAVGFKELKRYREGGREWVLIILK
ncbi:MAG: GNAT family N-acetyltransferase [Bacteroidota bacterium]